MNFIDQAIAYGLLKNAISPETVLRVVKNRLRSVVRQYPESAEAAESILANATNILKGKTAFKSPSERQFARDLLGFVKTMTKPVDLGQGPIPPIADPQTRRIIKAMHKAISRISSRISQLPAELSAKWPKF
ncbi:MAG: hypothetical protein QXI71_06905 [Candidatus Bathyarchaeia archaeon]